MAGENVITLQLAADIKSVFPMFENLPLEQRPPYLFYLLKKSVFPLRYLFYSA